MDIGKVGIWFFLDAMTAAESVEFARKAEKLGYGAMWIPEAVGREPFAHSAYLAAHTERIIFATGIANIWARDPITMSAASKTVADVSGGRFLLGIGVSHKPLVANLRGHSYDKPYSYMRDYLPKIKSALYRAPMPKEPVPVKRALYLGQIIAHVAVGLVVAMAAQIGDERLVAHADPKQEAATRHVGDRLGRRRHRDRVARPDIRDTGREYDSFGMRGEVGRMRKRLASDRLGNPHRTVAEFFGLTCELHAFRRRHRVEEKPNADFADIHASLNNPPADASQAERKRPAKSQSKIGIFGRPALFRRPRPFPMGDGARYIFGMREFTDKGNH